MKDPVLNVPVKVGIVNINILLLIDTNEISVNMLVFDFFNVKKSVLSRVKYDLGAFSALDLGQVDLKILKQVNI
ncbi:hypothetical protein BB561_004697 [Smittium simulii]|uniref:Uncharacterized protein n=1 Tax=Smittium simulii TaxID=133385 RepID=A0A2T9YES4_9FUNG|nr:hypothetical protein BB561_004697 [Smittium simulii]